MSDITMKCVYHACIAPLLQITQGNKNMIPPFYPHLYFWGRLRRSDEPSLKVMNIMD